MRADHEYRSSTPHGVFHKVAKLRISSIEYIISTVHLAILQIKRDGYLTFLQKTLALGVAGQYSVHVL